VAVIDGPYDATAMSWVLARTPISFGNNGSCSVNPRSACDHGTFVMGLLGARPDALLPGFCSDCEFLHFPLFVDEVVPQASVEQLARAIMVVVAAGARLINLSLAILGDDAQDNRELTTALDRAEASGAVLLVAAGNQGRLAMGQLLSHPVTVPVVAVDAEHKLLPDCNFGPSISRRGVSAFGHEVLGYAPGGGTTVMSGTSVATAVATGILSQVWSARPETEGAKIRAGLARLAPRNGPVPPMLNSHALLAALDQQDVATVAGASALERSKMTYVTLQGGTAMNDEIALSRSNNRCVAPAATSGQAVIPAQALNGCACGAQGGICTCSSGNAPPSNFVYVLGTVDVRFPDQSISDEFQRVAGDLEQGQDEDLRDWCHRVLSQPDARYVARQVSWILTVEGLPAYYLALRDLHDLPCLIGFLAHSRGSDLDLFVGSSSLVPVETCPGIVAPVLAVDQLCSFTQAKLSEWFERSATTPPTSRSKKRARGTDESDPNEPDPHRLFALLVQSADNFGDTDQWRALNYLAVRGKRVYEKYAEMLENGYILDSVRVANSRLWREKRILDPVFSFRETETGVMRKYFVRVDVSHLYPIMINDITEYFDR
jgi:hypothetical protein